MLIRKIICSNSGIIKATSNDVATKYGELNATINQICKLVHVGINLNTSALMFSALVMTAINYFVYDRGDDSYYLPIAVM